MKQLYYLYKSHFISFVYDRAWIYSNTITQIQPYAVDHLAHESMKSAANCVN